MWFWSNIPFWLAFGQQMLSGSNFTEANVKKIHEPIPIYTEITMVPFTKNRRFHMHRVALEQQEGSEWVQALVIKKEETLYWLGFQQRAMKNALKLNADFRLEKLEVDRVFPFVLRDKQNDKEANATAFVLQTGRAVHWSQDSIFYTMQLE